MTPNLEKFARLTKLLKDLLTVKNYSVKSGSVSAVRQVDFKVSENEKLGIVGESGAGKSMLGLSLMGLLPFGWESTGSAELAGRELVSMSEKDLVGVRGRDISMVFQDSLSALNPMKKIGKHLEFAFKHAEVSRREGFDEYILALMHSLKIDDPELSLQKYPHQLSGGQRQRILIGMAVACNPRLIVADEPTTSVDSVIQRDVLDVLISNVSRLGASLVLITHDLAVVSNYCEKIIVMYAGKIVESGPVASVMGNPKHPYTKALIGSHISLKHIKSGMSKRLPVIPGMMPAIQAIPTGCAFKTRCGSATAACEVQPPNFLIGERTVSCWHIEDQSE